MIPLSKIKRSLVSLMRPFTTFRVQNQNQEYGQNSKIGDDRSLLHPTSLFNHVSIRQYQKTTVDDVKYEPNCTYPISRSEIYNTKVGKIGKVSEIQGLRAQGVVQKIQGLELRRAAIRKLRTGNQEKSDPPPPFEFWSSVLDLFGLTSNQTQVIPSRDSKPLFSLLKLIQP